MSDVLLTALKFGKYIIAKNNTGNKSIIINNYNGFLFNNLNDINEKNFLIDSLTEKIISKNCIDYFNNYHNKYKEKEAYQSIISLKLENDI
jgi:hypothetical protein